MSSISASENDRIVNESAEGAVMADDAPASGNSNASQNFLWNATLVLGIVLGILVTLVFQNQPYRLDWSKASFTAPSAVRGALITWPSIIRIDAAQAAKSPAKEWLPPTADGKLSSHEPPQSLPNKTAPADTRMARAISAFEACMKKLPPKHHVMHWSVAQGFKDPWTDSRCRSVRLKGRTGR